MLPCIDHKEGGQLPLFLFVTPNKCFVEGRSTIYDIIGREFIVRLQLQHLISPPASVDGCNFGLPLVLGRYIVIILGYDNS